MRYRLPAKPGEAPDESEYIVLSRQELRDVDFSKRRFAQFSVEGCRFERCRFDHSRFDCASFGAGRFISEYVDCTFDHTRIRFMAGGYCRFVRCSFRKARLTDWLCFAVELVECVFTGRIGIAVFNGTVPLRDRDVARRERNEFRDNDFSEAKLVDVGFRTGVDLRRQKLPTGSQYLYLPDAAGALRQARAAVNDVVEDDQRKQMLTLMQLIEEEVLKGQEQIFRCLPAEGSSSFEITNRLYRLLEDRA